MKHLTVAVLLVNLIKLTSCRSIEFDDNDNRVPAYKQDGQNGHFTASEKQVVEKYNLFTPKYENEGQIRFKVIKRVDNEFRRHREKYQQLLRQSLKKENMFVKNAFIRNKFIITKLY